MAKGQGGPASHSRGTKLPYWRTRHVDKRIERELKAIRPKEGVVMKFKFQFDLEHTDTSQRVLMNSLVIRG